MTSFLWAQQFCVNLLREGSPRVSQWYCSPLRPTLVGACIVLSLLQEPWIMLVDPNYSRIVHTYLMCIHTRIQQETDSPLGNQKGCLEKGGLIPPHVNSTLFLVCFERMKNHDAVVIEYWLTVIFFFFEVGLNTSWLSIKILKSLGIDVKTVLKFSFPH